MEVDEFMNRLVRLPRRRLPAGAAFLVGATLLVFGGVAPVAHSVGGGAGLVAAGTAAVVCLSGALLALVASGVFCDPGRVLSGFLVGTTLRTGVPLCAALVVQVAVPVLADAHVLVYFLAFYPVTLFVETLVSLPGAYRSEQGGEFPRSPVL